MNARPPATLHQDAAQALQACLERIEAGADLDSALVDGGIDKAGQLAPLLVAAAIVKQHRAQPSDDFRRRTGRALALAEPPRRTLLLGPGFGLGPRAGILRLVAAAAAIVLALGGLTVVQASRNPEGWAWRTLARAWSAARVVPERLAPSAVVMPVGALSTPNQPSFPAEGRPQAMGPEQHETMDGGAFEPDRSAVTTPGVLLGRKPRSPVAAGAPAPSATMLPSAYVASTATSVSALPTVALSGGATPTGERTRPVAAVAAATTAAPFGSPPAVVAPPGKALGASMGGRVTVQGGRPLPGIPVIVFRHDGEGNARWWDAVATARTDADGRYRLRDLSPDSYKVMAGYPFFFAPRRWYPSASRSVDGQAVVLAAGQERDDIDLSFGEEMVAPLLLWALMGR